MLSRTLVAARTKLMRTTLDVVNQIRGLMKTFGLIVPCSSKFEVHVRSLLADNAGLSRIILSLLEAWRSLRLQAARLGQQILAEARRNQQCQLLMSIPGVDAITATTYLTAVEVYQALPYIFVGLDVAIVLSIIGAIVGEFVGSQAGLGYLIMQSNFSMDMARTFAILVVLSVMGMALHGVTQAIQRRVLFWMKPAEDRVMGA